MRLVFATLFIGALLAVTYADKPIGDDWGVYGEPQWKQVCFDKTTGELVQHLTPAGFCQRLDRQCISSPGTRRSCAAGGGSCSAMDGWCVCQQSTDAKVDHNLYRCHAVARGELEAPISGVDNDGHHLSTPPESAFLYACFDKDSNEVIPHLKPDGFCSSKLGRNGEFHPVSYDCHDDASCVPVPGSKTIWSCQRDDVKSAPPGHVCMHMNAVELSAAVRGWPHPSDISEFL